MLNINKTKTKTYNKEVDKMNLMTNKIKEGKTYSKINNIHDRKDKW